MEVESDRNLFERDHPPTIIDNLMISNEDINNSKDIELISNERKRGTERHSRFKYAMGRGGKGLLFDNEYFKVKDATQRVGTKVDAIALINQLKKSNIDLKRCTDYSLKQIRSEIVELSEKTDHEKYDCLVVIVLSHGLLTKDRNEEILASDDAYSPTELWLPFSDDRCPSLAGKPKIFIIQACRGDQINKGNENTKISTPSGKVKYARSKIHNMPDLLIARSTINSYKSYRFPDTGTIYINSLTKHLDLFPEKEFISILTLVNKEISKQTIYYSDGDKNEEPVLQMPCFISSLTRRLYFS